MHDRSAGFIICSAIALAISFAGGVFARQTDRKGTVNVGGYSGRENANSANPETLRCMDINRSMATTCKCIDCTWDAICSCADDKSIEVNKKHSPAER